MTAKAADGLEEPHREQKAAAGSAENGAASWVCRGRRNRAKSNRTPECSPLRILRAVCSPAETLLAGLCVFMKDSLLLAVIMMVVEGGS